MSSSPDSTSDIGMPLPGRSGGFVGFVDSIKHLTNPGAFIAKWTKRHGPIFQTTLFFSPTVIIGDAKAVEEMVSKEEDIASLGLPEPFRELHTVHSALNHDGDRHKASRVILQELLNLDMFQEYLPETERRITTYLADLSESKETYLAKDQISFWVRYFGELWCNRQLSDEEIQMFKDYNTGLYALGSWDPKFKTAKAALDHLVAANIKGIEEARARSFSRPRDSLIKKLSTCVDETGEIISDERIAVIGVLFTWGAYTQLTSALSYSIIEMAQNPKVAANMLEEAREAGLLGLTEPAEGGLKAYAGLPYTVGVIKETLRVYPPTGGGFRKADKDLEIGGYRVPKGFVVSADTRILHINEKLHPKPEQFEPLRWCRDEEVGEGGGGCPFAGAATMLSKFEWFPGGTGAHQCPGLPLAELISKVFLIKWAEKFSSWQAEDPDAPVPEVLIPLRLPSEEYKLILTPRE